LIKLKSQAVFGGFTLIELLAAMAIFSLLAVAMYGGTQFVMLEREIIMERQGFLRELQRAVRYLNDDLSQLQNRPVRDELGRDYIAALSAQPGLDYVLELSRDGWRNPAQSARGTLQRVQYRLEEETLIREYWPVMDRILGMEGREQELISGVDEFVIAFLDESGEWQESWPVATTGSGQAAPLPVAVRYRLETQSFGEIERLVQITR
jgi:general secretion pathway protein J